jgi:CelD/BcsL family acetyltransferase involved in cellulose biosynthesis
VVTVEWIDDPQAFVARDWTPLARADPEATVFHTPRYLKLFWEEFGAERLQIALVGRGDERIAAAAFDLRDRVLTWLGGFDVTDYMGPVGFPDAREAAAKELMSAVASRDDWREAELAGLPVRSAWLAALRTGAEAAGLSAQVDQDDVAPFLRLPGSFEDYLGRLSAKLRHEIRRKDRRIRAAFTDVRLVDAGPETMLRDLEVFVGLHRSSPGDKGRFMVPGMELFFRRLAEAMLPDGTLRLAFLQADGQRVAGAVGFRDGDRFLLYNSAYDHRLSAVAPGMVLVAELIRSAIAEGRHGFDMLTGDLPYKYRFGARQRRMGRLRLRRP